MRLRIRHPLFAAAFAVALLALPAGAAEPPPIEAVDTGPYSHAWSPAQTAASTGESVTVRNPTATPHGVEWHSGPVTPVCSAGVPVSTALTKSGANWSGTCTFTKPGTYVFYCTVHGPEMTETITVTTPGAPIATTGAASGVGETAATLQGSVNPQGNATTYFFEYGTTTAYGTHTSEESAGAGSAAKAVSAPLGALTPGTTYHYRLVAKNSVERVAGEDHTFTTASPPAKPSATTNAASAVGETEATLQGSVNPNGKPTTYLFEWGATSAYGQATSEAPAGEDGAAHTVTAQLSGLAAGTTYHYRIVAKNSLGTTPGADLTFATGAIPPTPPPPPPSTTPTEPPPSPAPAPTLVPTTPSPPPVKPAAGPTVTLRSNQHGSAVKGALVVPAADAGARLEVDLLARGAAGAHGRHAPGVVVGRTVRGAVGAGEVSFTVKLNARPRSALGRHRRLALIVRIVLRPAHGPAVTATRAVVLVR